MTEKKRKKPKSQYIKVKSLLNKWLKKEGLNFNDYINKATNDYYTNEKDFVKDVFDVVKLDNVNRKRFYISEKRLKFLVEHSFPKFISSREDDFKEIRRDFADEAIIVEWYMFKETIEAIYAHKHFRNTDIILLNLKHHVLQDNMLFYEPSIIEKSGYFLNISFNEGQNNLEAFWEYMKECFNTRWKTDEKLQYNFSYVIFKIDKEYTKLDIKTNKIAIVYDIIFRDLNEESKSRVYEYSSELPENAKEISDKYYNSLIEGKTIEVIERPEAEELEELDELKKENEELKKELEKLKKERDEQAKIKEKEIEAQKEIEIEKNKLKADLIKEYMKTNPSIEDLTKFIDALKNF